MTNLDQMAVWSHDAVAATYYVDGDELPEITPATYYTEDDTLPDGVSVGDEKTAAVYAQVGDEKTPAKDAYTEDNEQLNCVAVSSVEGDPNVAGVLSSWDDDDQFNDMKIGMTGTWLSVSHKAQRLPEVTYLCLLVMAQPSHKVMTLFVPKRLQK